MHDHIWSRAELFNKIYHKMALVSIVIAMEKRPPEKLVMIVKFLFGSSLCEKCRNMFSKHRKMIIINNFWIQE